MQIKTQGHHTCQKQTRSEKKLWSNFPDTTHNIYTENWIHIHSGKTYIDKWTNSPPKHRKYHKVYLGCSWFRLKLYIQNKIFMFPWRYWFDWYFWYLCLFSPQAFSVLVLTSDMKRLTLQGIFFLAFQEVNIA